MEKSNIDVVCNPNAEALNLACWEWHTQKGRLSFAAFKGHDKFSGVPLLFVFIGLGGVVSSEFWAN